MLNGFESLALTKLDVLDPLDRIPVCVGYRVHGRPVEAMPATTEELEAVEPVYEWLPGWVMPTAGITSYEKLPERARAYLEFLEEKVGVEIGCISTGPERGQTILRPGSRMEKLIHSVSI
jgi:adenylosuccinate synthase